MRIRAPVLAYVFQASETDPGVCAHSNTLRLGCNVIHTKVLEELWRRYLPVASNGCYSSSVCKRQLQVAEGRPHCHAKPDSVGALLGFFMATSKLDAYTYKLHNSRPPKRL